MDFLSSLRKHTLAMDADLRPKIEARYKALIASGKSKAEAHKILREEFDSAEVEKWLVY